MVAAERHGREASLLWYTAPTTPRGPDGRPGGGDRGPPLGHVTEDALHVELTNTPGLPPGDQAVETRLAPVRNHVDSLRSALERFQTDLHDVGLRALEHRREQAEARRQSPAPCLAAAQTT